MSLTLFDVAMAGVLMAVAIGISWQLKLSLAKTLWIAGVRTLIQLSVIGLILAWVFAHESLWQVLTILTIMTLIASVSAKNRIKKPYQGLLCDTIISLTLATTLVTAFAVVFVLNVSPWYRPQFIIPILGLILGNSLTAISLTTSQLIDSLHDKKSHIIAHLALSATPFEAVHPFVKSAIISGMTPTINSMMVVGLVSLPGMMTGQILAGADPTQAVRYQIVTMFFICVGSTLSCTLSALLVVRRFFDGRGRLIHLK